MASRDGSRPSLVFVLTDDQGCYVDPALDGTREAVCGKGQLALAGPAGQGVQAHGDDWCHLDDDGNRRAEP